MGPLWDFDNSAGTNWGGGPEGWTTQSGAWFARLWVDAGFRVTLRDRWAVLLAALDALSPSGYQGWLDRLIDAETLAIGRDDKRWTQTTYPPMEADRRKRWLAARIAWLHPRLTAEPDTYSDIYTDTY